MRQRTSNAVLALGCLFLYSSSTSSAPNVEESQVRQVVGDYIEGWREADAERLSQVFALDNGHVIWLSDKDGSETVESMSFGDIVSRDKEPNPEYGRNSEILALDVVDDKLAVAKVEISFSKGNYIDYLVLYKVGDDWRIATKTFVTRLTGGPGR